MLGLSDDLIRFCAGGEAAEKGGIVGSLIDQDDYSHPEDWKHLQ